VSAPLPVFVGFVPAAPTAVYTFVSERPNGRGVITFLSLVNTGGAVAVNFRIVPAGQALAGNEWCVIPKDMPLDAVSSTANPWAVYCKDDFESPSHVLKNGDQIVLNANVAARVAARVIVQELMA
jgi:hypothetical protein